MQPPVDKAGHKLLVQSGQEEVEKWAVTMADNSMCAYQCNQHVYCIARPISYANAYVCNFVLSSHAQGCAFKHDGCSASQRCRAIHCWAAIKQVLCSSTVAACMWCMSLVSTWHGYLAWEFVHGHLALALTLVRALALGVCACGRMCLQATGSHLGEAELRIQEPPN